MTLYADDTNLAGTELPVSKQGDGDFGYDEGLNLDGANAVLQGAMFKSTEFSVYVKFTAVDSESNPSVATIMVLPIGHLDYDEHNKLHFVVNGESTELATLKGAGKENQIALSYDSNDLTVVVNHKESVSSLPTATQPSEQMSLQGSVPAKFKKLMYYDRALSVEELSELYENDKVISDDNLVEDHIIHTDD